MSDLDQAISAIVRDCLGVREGEEVLVIANQATIGLGERLRAEAGRAGADGVLALMADREVDGAEPPASVGAENTTSVAGVLVNWTGQPGRVAPVAGFSA